MEIYWSTILFGLLFIIVNFILVLFTFRFFGKIGMFMWICIVIILANIQVLKFIDLMTINGFTVVATLGNSLYGSIFLATDILSEHYDKKDAKRSVWLGFAASIIMIITMQMALMFAPSQSDFVNDALRTIFTLTPRIVAGSLAAYLVSQFLDIHLFYRLKKSNPKKLWLRNNVATMISQLVDTLIFTTFAFIGVVSVGDFWSIFVTTYVLKFIVAIIDTPFLYLAKSIKPNEL